jgi:hypothetical protein
VLLEQERKKTEAMNSIVATHHRVFKKSHSNEKNEKFVQADLDQT